MEKPPLYRREEIQILVEQSFRDGGQTLFTFRQTRPAPDPAAVQQLTGYVDSYRFRLDWAILTNGADWWIWRTEGEKDRNGKWRNRLHGQPDTINILLNGADAASRALLPYTRLYHQARPLR